MTHPGVLLHTHGMRASKRRGQNFLCQPATALSIVRSAGLTLGDVVLEIGAGLGALTLAAASLAGRVIAIEVDRGLHQVLVDLLQRQGVANVDLRLTDALALDWPATVKEAGGPLVVVGNLPYAISSPLLFKLLENRACWRSATLMVQREVATRLLTQPGGKDYGRLSVLMQTWLEVRRGQVVGSEQFFPQPAVDSQILHFRPLEEPMVPLAGPTDAEWFAKVVKAAYSQRRKTLANSLTGGLGRSREEVLQALAVAHLNPVRRAETLSPQELGRVAAALAPPGGSAMNS
ncbi:Ribosomal RNA small subunit methyltransferase A [Desulfarculales bacterium]